ncbi:hypothetical protein RSAG8_03975, partial [Rhizoctonia solani AG-8 WAC10335]
MSDQRNASMDSVVAEKQEVVEIEHEPATQGQTPTSGPSKSTVVAEKQEVVEIEHEPATQGQTPTSGPSKSTNAHGDAALAILGASNVPVEISPEEDAAVLRKVDRWLLPVMLMVYFLQQLDKSSLSYASVFGIVSDTNLVGSQYSWLGSIVYVAQLIWQPISSYLLVKLPVGKYLFCNVFMWGVVVASMAAAHNFSGLLATRFFLGIFEATEKVVALERLRANNQGLFIYAGTESKNWEWSQVREVLTDPKTYLWLAMQFVTALPSGGISTFGPLIIRGFGFNQFHTILLNIPFGALQVIITLGSAAIATKLKLKWPVLFLLTLPPIAGAAALYELGRGTELRNTLLGCYYVLGLPEHGGSYKEDMYNGSRLCCSMRRKRESLGHCSTKRLKPRMAVLSPRTDFQFNLLDHSSGIDPYHSTLSHFLEQATRCCSQTCRKESRHHRYFIGGHQTRASQNKTRGPVVKMVVRRGA